jgi:hypothetical protein
MGSRRTGLQFMYQCFDHRSFPLYVQIDPTIIEIADSTH